MDLVAFEVDLNEGRLDQVGDILQMNGGGLVRTPKSLLFIQPGGFSGAFGAVHEIHRASECALQGLLKPIDWRGEAKLVSPRGFLKVNPLAIGALAKINSRGECHEAPGCITVDADKAGSCLLKGFSATKQSSGSLFKGF